MGRRKKGIPGLSFSWKRALGISSTKAKLSRQLGIPLTRAGRQRKVGKALGCCILAGLILAGGGAALLSVVKTVTRLVA
jgi:hypothetical protein